MTQSNNIKQRLLREMTIAIAEGDWKTSNDLFSLAQTIDDPKDRADVLNNLLVMPGHELHQEITREIQKLRSPSSVPYIRRLLIDDFRMFEYTCSEPGVIAKWFSHALAEIDTPEAIALIKEFAGSSNPEIAEEMTYRLSRLTPSIHIADK